MPYAWATFILKSSIIGNGISLSVHLSNLQVMSGTVANALSLIGGRWTSETAEFVRKVDKFLIASK